VQKLSGPNCDALFGSIADDDLDAVLGNMSHLPSPNVVIEPRRHVGGFVLPLFFAQGCTPLALAAWMGSPRVTRCLIDLGADWNMRDEYGRRVTHYACAGGNFDVIRELEQLGAEWDLPCDSGEYPADLASRFGRLEVLQWLWSKGYLDGRGQFGFAPANGGDRKILFYAAAGGHLAVLMFLLAHVEIPLLSDMFFAPRTECVLLQAVLWGHDCVVKFLLGGGTSWTHSLSSRRAPLDLRGWAYWATLLGRGPSNV
jgi:hypothetical protein